MSLPTVSHPARKVSSFVAHDGPVRCANIGSKSGQLIATGGDDSAVNVWRVGHHGSLRSFDAKKEVSQVIFDRGENRILGGTTSGAVKLWELESSKQFHPLRDNIIASGGGEGVIRLWDARSGAEFIRYTGHAAAITCLRFTPHGRIIASASADGKMILFDLAAGKPIADITAHKGGVTAMDFHPTEFIMVTAGGDHTVKFWAMEPLLKLACTSPAHSTQVRGGKFVPPTTGTAFAAVTSDNLRMWSFPPAILGEACPASGFKTETLDLVDVPWGSVVSTWVGDSIKSSARTTSDATATQPLHMMAASIAGNSLNMWAVNLSQLAPLAARPLHAFSVMSSKAEPTKADTISRTDTKHDAAVRAEKEAFSEAAAKAELRVEKMDTAKYTPATAVAQEITTAKTAHEDAKLEHTTDSLESPPSDSAYAFDKFLAETKEVEASPVRAPEIIAAAPQPTNSSIIAVQRDDTPVQSKDLFVPRVKTPMQSSSAATDRHSAAEDVDSESKSSNAVEPDKDKEKDAASKLEAIMSAVSKAQEAAASAVAARAQALDMRRPKELKADDKSQPIESNGTNDKNTGPPSKSAGADTSITTGSAAKGSGPDEPKLRGEAKKEAHESSSAAGRRATDAARDNLRPDPPLAVPPTEGGAVKLGKRSAGDFVPATRHEPVGLDFALFLPANTARGFGASRVFPGGLSSTLTRSGKLIAADEQVMKIILQDRGQTVRALTFRLHECESAAALWADSDVKGALAILRVAAETDPEIGASFLKHFKVESGALNLESAQLLIELLAVMLKQTNESYVSAAAATVPGLIRAFGGFVKSTLEAGKDGLDLAGEERYSRSNNFLQAGEFLRQKLSTAPKSGEVDMAKQLYEEWRSSLPLQAVAQASRAAASRTSNR